MREFDLTQTEFKMHLKWFILIFLPQKADLISAFDYVCK